MTYLQLGESKTKNEVSQVAWQNFYNTVSHELNLARSLRQDPTDFVTRVKMDYDRLFEISPICSHRFIMEIKKKVRKSASDQFQIPTYLNGFSHTRVWDGEDSFKSNESEVRV
jgi:hypothetical protein